MITIWLPFLLTLIHGCKIESRVLLGRRHVNIFCIITLYIVVVWERNYYVQTLNQNAADSKYRHLTNSHQNSAFRIQTLYATKQYIIVLFSIHRVLTTTMNSWILPQLLDQIIWLKSRARLTRFSIVLCVWIIIISLKLGTLIIYYTFMANNVVAVRVR
jgi:hypothetical protein